MSVIIKKLTALVKYTTPVSGDLVPIYDAATGETKAMDVDDFPGGGGGATWSFVGVRNTDVATDINTASWTAIPFGGTVDDTSADYTPATSSITVNFTGTVAVSVVVSQFMSTGSAVVGCRITKNGSVVSGVGHSHFLLAGSYPTISSANVDTVTPVTSGDIIRVECLQRFNAGTVVQLVGETKVIIERRS